MKVWPIQTREREPPASVPQYWTCNELNDAYTGKGSGNMPGYVCSSYIENKTKQGLCADSTGEFLEQ